MKALVGLVLGVAAAAMSGCTLVPTTEFNACQAENRNLSDQNRAQLAEIQNLKVHSRDVEDRVIRSERQLARLEERAGLDQKQLETYQRERDGLYVSHLALDQRYNPLGPFSYFFFYRWRCGFDGDRVLTGRG